MRENKKKALLFCVDNKEREMLSIILDAFSVEVLEETCMNRAINVVNEHGIDYILGNEEEEKFISAKSIFTRQANTSFQFICFHKSAFYFYLKIFRNEEDFFDLKIDINYFFGNQKSREISNDNLLSILSHEMFTPLNSVLGFSKLLQEYSYTEKDVKKYSGYIYKSGQKIHNKYRLLLDFIALKEGGKDCHFSYFSIVSLFCDLLEKYKFKKESILLEVEYNYDLSQVEVFTDKTKVEKILENLLDNAIKFTEEGTVVFGFAINKNKSLVLFVKDTGIGISKEHLNSVFDAFWQVDNSDSRRYGGLGIGLYLVKEFLDQLNGKIILNSEESKGTCIQIEIPLPESIQSETIQLEEACSFK
ncbi:sensor histidine kinase [Labilibaculum euxinus]